VVYAPVITDGINRVSLPAVVVQGRRAEVAWQRHEWAAGTENRYPEAYYTENGAEVDYRAEVPFQPWMHDARIEVGTVMAGCGDSFIGRSIWARRILPAPPRPEPRPAAPEPVLPEPTLAETLARTFPFVLPASEFDPNEPIRFYDDERDNALTVYYRINRYDIEAEYADNRQTLINLLAAIQAIQASGTARVERVVVAGFASPEGPFAFNDRLAWERAVSVKKYILDNGSMTDRAITVFNGSADWRGLRRLVEQDDQVPGQREVLELLDSRPKQDVGAQAGHMNRLRTLHGGRTYRYLADRIFPLLRNGTFIRVYFDPKER
jgi:outer membrane protein OmpA-like peptidoglycan-associated protein